MSLIEQAKNILRINDLDGYTVPTKTIYPFQWNWDSAITALGWMSVDESRAWLELKTLLSGQWSNGMIPHIIFHKDSSSYFPNADVWGTHHHPQTSAISQPPVLASVMATMLDSTKDQQLAVKEIKLMLGQVINYHLWWYRERDPNKTGLVVSYHPWESGMDNSPAWDDSLSRVPASDKHYQRKDTMHVAPEERPTKAEYDRYIYLVDFYKKNNFDSQYLFNNCPYKMMDIGIIAILHKATKDLVWLYKQVKNYLDESFDEEIDELTERLSLTNKNISTLWSSELSTYLSKDAITQTSCPTMTTGTLMVLFSGLANEQQANQMKPMIEDWINGTKFAISSTHPKCDKFESQRYWRGPVWLHINWLVAQGLETYGWDNLSMKLKTASHSLIEKSGFFEYYDCNSGAGCGGADFSWTSAIALHWLLD